MIAAVVAVTAALSSTPCSNITGYWTNDYSVTSIEFSMPGDKLKFEGGFTGNGTIDDLDISAYLPFAFTGKISENCSRITWQNGEIWNNACPIKNITDGNRNCGGTNFMPQTCCSVGDTCVRGHQGLFI